MKFIKTTENNTDINIIKTSKFKTIRIQMTFVGVLAEESVTARALLPYVLKSVTNTYKEEEDLQKKLEEMYAASLHVGVNKIGGAHAITFDLSIINNRYTIQQEDLFDDALHLLYDVVFNPFFKEDTFHNEKRFLKEYFQGTYANKMKYAMNQLVQNMFQDEVYRINHLGKEEDLDSLTIQDLKDAYQTLITNDKVFFTIVGDVDDAAVIKKIQTVFPNIKNNPLPSLLSDKNKDIQEVNILKEEQDVTQAKLAIGYRFNIRYREKGYFAAILLNLLLGGSTESLLFQEIREKHGLVYFINSSYQPYQGALFIYAGINQEDYKKVLREIDTIIHSIQQGDISEMLVETMKKLFINGVIQGMDSNYTLAGKIAQSYLFDFTYDLDETIKEINAVSKDDVVEVSHQIKKDTIFLLRGPKQ